MAAGRVDGVIVVSSFAGDERFDFLQAARVPHVYMMRAVPGSSHNVVIDDEKVSALAVEHLYELGHRRLAHVAGFSSIEATARRAKGFLRRCADLGVVGFVHEAELNERGGFDVFQPLFEVRQARPRCTRRWLGRRSASCAQRTQPVWNCQLSLSTTFRCATTSHLRSRASAFRSTAWPTTQSIRSSPRSRESLRKTWSCRQSPSYLYASRRAGLVLRQALSQCGLHRGPVSLPEWARPQARQSSVDIDRGPRGRAGQRDTR